MNVDKNLFLYDLAVVSIMKCEGPYVKEWLDYHLLAGVDHFFIYDNDSPDNQREVVQPYVDAGLVTYIFYPGKARQIEAYNAAIRDYKFFCRYMAFIDGDEFIFPLSKPTIVEVVDEVLADKPNAAALGANIYYFGSNYQDYADYSRGLLERFTRRASVDYTPIMESSGLHGGTAHISTITNPRRVNYFFNSHFAIYCDGYFAANENGQVVPFFSNHPPTIEKIVMNHYSIKSREEYIQKVNRGTADSKHNVYKLESFSHDDECNEVFDDSILKYRDERLAAFKINNDDIIDTFAEIKQLDFDRLLNALAAALLPGFKEKDAKKFLSNPINRFEYFKTLTKFLNTAPNEMFEDKAEIFLTCLSLSIFLHETDLDDELGRLFEEMSLNAVCKSFRMPFSIADMQLLIKELPNILSLSYSTVNEIREICFKNVPEFMDKHRVHHQFAWKAFVELDYLLQMLRVFDKYNHK